MVLETTQVQIQNLRYCNISKDVQLQTRYVWTWTGMFVRVPIISKAVLDSIQFVTELYIDKVHFF